jgi:hypothetical protein
MKKLLVTVIVLSVTGASVFAAGILDFAKKEPSSSRSSVATAADLAEVPDEAYYPRRNPRAEQAQGEVYAVPAKNLKEPVEALPPPVYAISGVKNQEIRVTYPTEVVDIVVILPEGDSFNRDISETWDATAWIQNLPSGLTARAHEVKKGAREIRLFVSGTPTEARRSNIRVKIPASFLANGREREFVSSTEEIPPPRAAE